EKLFLVEGDKIVQEVLNSDYTVEKLFATNSYLALNEQHCNKAKLFFEVSRDDIKKASLLNHPQSSMALCSIQYESDYPDEIGNNLTIYLDDIQDPGNLGTIIRVCDWFKIEYLFCSPKTVDFYNPKVIQASMGSFSRVKIRYIPFEAVANSARLSDTPIYGAFLQGENIYQEKLPQKAIVVMGNEGKGIQKEIESRIERKLKIPEFSTDRISAESLNVSVATAIICSEFKRKLFV
ncbi:RNA methyltransferase, partial [Draconibacterium sp.]|nr:RNA methyltransferase [Draconibacterium sp.]